MVHPTTGDIYIITKSYAGASKVYKFPQPLPAPGTMSTLVFVADLQLPTTTDTNYAAATSGNIHPCANRFLLRTYRKVYEFRAAPGAAFETTFAATPVSLTDTVEGQGEAIEYGEGVRRRCQRTRFDASSPTSRLTPGADTWGWPRG